MTLGPLFLRGRLTRLAASLALAAFLWSAALAERPNAPQLLPDTTALLLWVPNAPETARRFQNTMMGQMIEDPQLKPLVNHLYGALGDAVAQAKDRIGLSLPELLAIPQGELAIAVVAPEGEAPELVALFDVGDQLSNARKLLARLDAELQESGAQKSQQSLGDTKLAVYDGVGPRKRRLILLEKGSTVVMGSKVEAIKGVLSAWDAKGDARHLLAHQAKFSAIMQRSGSAEQKPQVVWYADPIALVRSAGQRNPGVQAAILMLPFLGLDGVKALGGSFTFDAGPYDSTVYWHLLLDRPRTGIPKMIALEPGETTPEPWVPADVANYTTLHWDFETTYREVVSLYDSFRGSEGAFSDLLKKRVSEPLGLDIEKELLPALAGRVTHFTWIERPVTFASQRTALALKLNDPEAFAKLLERIAEKHVAFLARESYGGKQYFHITPPGQREEPSEPAGPGERRRPPRPIPCFGIVQDYFLITDRPSLYQHVLITSQGAGQPLADALDFKLVASKFPAHSGGAAPGMIAFERPVEGMRMLYEMATSDQARGQLRRGAENNPFLKSLNTALDQNPLPPFTVIEQYLAPNGGVLVDDESGLHYTGFALRRKSE